MLAEYALEPELLGNWRDYRFFVSQFGPSKGRLISRYPRKWKRLVIEAAQQAADVEYLKIEESLKNIDSMMLSRSHQWDPHQEWLSNALAEHTKRPFRGILARSKPADSTVVLSGDDIDPADPSPPHIWSVRLSVQIPRTAQEMANCVAPLLRHCKRVLFVDPHYDPSNRRHNLPLRAFLSMIASRDPQIAPPAVMEYHTSDKNKDIATFTGNLHRRIKPALPASSRLTVVRWRGEELHNRYVLTDRGGVMFGAGLDQDDTLPPTEDTVTLLAEQSCWDLMADYSKESTKLTWLDDTFTVASPARR